MKLCEYVEKAEKKAGKQIELAKILGISDAYIRNAKRERSGLPTAICMLLADYIDEDQIKVIAASELVTEKDEKKRKILESCFRKVASIAAAGIVTALVTIPIGSPTHAGSIEPVYQHTNYTQLNRRKYGRRQGDRVTLLLNNLVSAFLRFRSAS